MDLTKREDVLKEGLIKNEEEILRWETFKKENIKASENMEMFIKKYNVEVLVPIGGGKAFMPGYLYHTNEILVGHYNGLFSKCSTNKAQEIVKYRLKLARERLENLRKEKEMFQNKLEIPHTDGVLPNENQQEIIEEYDEEKEKIWKEEHRKRIREHKQKEKEQEKQESEEKTHEDVMQMLEQLELLEELDEELENLEIEDSDTLQKLISGEIKLPSEKRRISHENRNEESNVVLKNNKHENSNLQQNKTEEELNLDPTIEEIYKKYTCETSSKSQLGNDITNNNIIPNLVDFRQENNKQPDSDEDADDGFSTVSNIERDIENMCVRERIKYINAKIEETERTIDTLEISNIDDYIRKVSLLELREILMDRLVILEDQVDSDDDDDDNVNDIVHSFNKNDNNSVEKKSQKKISFALEDEIQLIDKNESVENMMKSNGEKTKDVIVLDPEIYQGNKTDTKEKYENGIKSEVVDKKHSILKKVEKSCNFVSENQSQKSFDLVGEIIGSVSSPKTLYIKFEHSDKVFTYPGYEINENCENEERVIGSPADIYRMFPQYFREHLESTTTMNKNEIQNQNHKLSTEKKLYTKKIEENSKNNPIYKKNLQQEKEKSQYNDHNDGKKQTFNISVNDQSQESQQHQQQNFGAKSILKNKEAVKLETHIAEEKKELQPEKNKRNKNKEENFKCYQMIVGDVVESTQKELKPEPLPEGKFIDTHAPKKRISRFKQMRDAVKTN